MNKKARQEVIDAFDEYATYESMAEITKSNYLFYINHYLDWLPARKQFKDTQHSEIVGFIAFWDKQFKERLLKKGKTGAKTEETKDKKKELSQNTKNLIKASLRTLYIANKRPDVATLIHGKKPKDRIPETIPIDSILQLIEASKSFYKDSWKNERTYYFVSLLYQSGGRIEEIVKIKRTKFDFDANVVKLFGKGSEYPRKLKPDWMESFKNWLDENNIKGYVFINHRHPKTKEEKENNFLPKRTAQWLITTLCSRILKRAYGPHKFRASCITHRLNAGEDFFLVSSNFHVNVQTTRRYIGASGRATKNMINPLEEAEKKAKKNGANKGKVL